MTRYDRVIPPGGTGQITLEIDTGKEIDEFERQVFVLSNDPQRNRLALHLKGEIKPHISLVPGGFLSLQGAHGQVPVEKLEIINNHKQPFKITGVINNLPDHIKWQLEEINSGYSYTLEVEDISKKPGDYSGRLIVQTDQPQKPELVILVTGYIEKN